MNGLPWQIYESELVDSTQDEAKRLAENETGIFAVRAAGQKAGRGQYGRAWLSPAGANILTTLAVPDRTVKAPGILALSAGCAVARCIEQFAADVECRWPNDIYIQDKKIAGILIEYTIGWYFIGIGCNVNWPGTAEPEYKAGWTSIAAESGSYQDCSGIFTRLMTEYSRLLEWSGHEIIDEYRNYWREKDIAVDVLVDKTWIPSRLRGINPDGTLEAEDAAGTKLTITSSATLRRLSI